MGIFPIREFSFQERGSIGFVNFTEAEKLKVMKSIELIQKVILTTEFKNKVINFQYLKKKEFFDNKGYSNEEIYELVKESFKKFKTKKKRPIDIELELYEDDTNLVGYTRPDSSKIWINKKFFKKFNLSQIANNILHEWLHKLGFEHEQKFSPRRKYSVPYAVGDILEEVALKNYPTKTFL
jgi:hypothetical protein